MIAMTIQDANLQDYSTVVLSIPLFPHFLSFHTDVLAELTKVWLQLCTSCELTSADAYTHHILPARLEPSPLLPCLAALKHREPWTCRTSHCSNNHCLLDHTLSIPAEQIVSSDPQSMNVQLGATNKIIAKNNLRAYQPMNN